LQDEFLSPDDDGMPGVVAAGIACHHGKPIGKNVDDLSFSLVAPLGTQYNRSLGSHELPSISCDALFPCRLGLDQTWLNLRKGVGGNIADSLARRPEFPVSLVGINKPHTAFREESRIRGLF
jgi:hypothetical protein